MSGHSKWSTIKRKKGANDAKRGKLFAKLIRGIEVAGKNGGADPNNNASLYQAISKAKSNSVPNSNIENALKRISGDSSIGIFDEITYEGYGPNGVAVLVECLTDNRNRTSSDIKATFNKFGGSTGSPGSVNYMFSRKAIFQFDEYKEEVIDIAIDNNFKLSIPPPALCTDNGVMIAWAGIEHRLLGHKTDYSFDVKARWPLGENCYEF